MFFEAEIFTEAAELKAMVLPARNVHQLDHIKGVNDIIFRTILDLGASRKSDWLHQNGCVKLIYVCFRLLYYVVHLLQLLRRILLQQCFAVKLLKGFVDHKIEAYWPSAWTPRKNVTSSDIALSVAHTKGQPLRNKDYKKLINMDHSLWTSQLCSTF